MGENAFGQLIPLTGLVDLRGARRELVENLGELTSGIVL